LEGRGRSAESDSESPSHVLRVGERYTLSSSATCIRLAVVCCITVSRLIERFARQDHLEKGVKKRGEHHLPRHPSARSRADSRQAEEASTPRISSSRRARLRIRRFVMLG
jgi:hypothetical protein